jgi:hypothetical protein
VGVGGEAQEQAPRDPAAGDDDGVEEQPPEALDVAAAQVDTNFELRKSKFNFGEKPGDHITHLRQAQGAGARVDARCFEAMGQGDDSACAVGSASYRPNT